MADPRADNCRAYKLDGNGKVVGILLQYKEHPETKYQLMRVDLIDEPSAAGGTVATFSVLDKNGIEVPEKVYLAWPWPNNSEHALPGNQNRQHMIVNKFFQPNVGPLAIYVGDTQANPISDEIGGLGLPDGHHVCFTMTFKERGGSGPGPGPVDPPPTGDLTETNGLLRELVTEMQLLNKHLGVTA